MNDQIPTPIVDAALVAMSDCEFVKEAKKLERHLAVAERDLTALRARLETCEAALHRCYALTGEDAGDIGDFRALVDRERHTVEAVQQMRRELDSSTMLLEQAERERDEAKRDLRIAHVALDERDQLRADLAKLKGEQNG